MLDRAPQVGGDRGAGDRDGADEASMLLVGAIQFVISNFLTIVAGVVLALAVMTVHLMTTTPTYTAYTQLLIDARLAQVLRDQLGDIGLSLDTAQVESQIAVLRSEQIALIVINKLRLMDDPTARSAGTEAGKDGAAAPPDPDRLRRLIQGYQGGLGIRRVGLSYVLEISYTSDDPVRAARFANATADAYVEDQLAARAQAARQGSQWLEERIEEIRNQVNAAALRVQEFKARRDYRILGRGNTGGGQQQVTGGAGGAGGDTVDKPDPPERRTLEELEATAQTYKKLYESYLQAYTESVQRQSYPATNARVITRASPPTSRSSPRTMRLLLLAAIVGGMAGLGVALLRRAVIGLVHIARSAPVS